MPSANSTNSTTANNMSQLVRDTYQANGLIRSHQQAAIASSQTSLQKLPAASPQFLSNHYQQLNSSNNQQQQQQQQQSMQFPPPPTMNHPHHQQQVPQNVLPMSQKPTVADHQYHSQMIVPQQQHLNTLAHLNNMMSHQQQQQQYQQLNGIVSNNGTLTTASQSASNILMSPLMAVKNTNITQQLQQQQQQMQITHPNIQLQQQMLVAVQQHQQQQQHHQQQQQQSQSQQVVPMTTIMIPATAASQLQAVSMQIQQAAYQASPHLQQTPQILVFMIPYMMNPTTGAQQQQQQQQQLSSSITSITPEQASLNSTLVRQSHSNSSMMRHSHPQQPQPQPQQQQQQPQQQSQSQATTSQQQTQTQTATTTNTSSHNRAVSSLSNSTTAHTTKQEPERFYVKANFTHRPTRNRQELGFQKGDILHVLDTLQNNDYGVQYWLATRVNLQTGEDAEKGLIPNKNKAEEIAIEQRTMDIGEQANGSGGGGGAGTSGTLDNSTSNGGGGGVLSASVGRVNFLKRRSAQRSKSLCKDNWDNVVFDIGSFSLPVYERVVFKHPGFCRPVVIFGPISDLAREKLLKDYPEKYSYPNGLASQQQQQQQQQPQQQSSSNNNNNTSDHPRVIRLKGVLDVIDQGKHALLDITAQAVEKLNHVNLAPIVIYMKTDSKSVIKEFRSRAAESLDPNARDEDTLRRDGKSSRKLLEQSLKLEKQWFHVFTAVLDLSTMGSEMWYRKLREIIENQQSANVWMGEKRSSDAKRQQLLAAAGSNSTLNNTNNKSHIVEQSIYATTGRAHHHYNQNQAQHQQQLQHSQSCIADSSSMLSERFNESMNLTTTKSTHDLLPVVQSSAAGGLDNAGLYGNRSQLRNAYAHSLAQKLARASSEPKLNRGLGGSGGDNGDEDDDDDDDDDDDVTLNGRMGMRNGHGHVHGNGHGHGHGNDDDDDDDDDDDECIKKPLFPNEYDNTSSISSSNGMGSNGCNGGFGFCHSGPSACAVGHLTYQQQHQVADGCQQMPPPPQLPLPNHNHLQIQHQLQQQQQQQQVKPPAPLPPQAAAAAAAALAANAAHEQQYQLLDHQQQQQQQQQQQHLNQLSANRSAMIAQESIYSMNNGASTNSITAAAADSSLPNITYGGANNGTNLAAVLNQQQQQQQHHRDYHPLPPMASLDNGYHQQQSNNTNSTSKNSSNPSAIISTQNALAPPTVTVAAAAANSNGSSNANGTSNGGGNVGVIDLARNHDTRGSAFQIYSDMNQNNYHYYNMNKI